MHEPVKYYLSEDALTLLVDCKGGPHRHEIAPSKMTAKHRSIMAKLTSKNAPKSLTAVDVAALFEDRPKKLDTENDDAEMPASDDIPADIKQAEDIDRLITAVKSATRPQLVKLIQDAGLNIKIPVGITNSELRAEAIEALQTRYPAQQPDATQTGE